MTRHSDLRLEICEIWDESGDTDEGTRVYSAGFRHNKWLCHTILLIRAQNPWKPTSESARIVSANEIISEVDDENC